MRILLTGATGFLGSQLCRRLNASGHRVTAYCRERSQTSVIESLGTRIVRGELDDSDSLRSAMREQETVVHAAADVAYWTVDLAGQTRVNVGGTAAVAEACRSQRVPRLVHVSSVAAIGITSSAGEPADERFRFNLDGTPCHYHQSKRRGEEVVLRAVEQGLDAVIVNPASIFGPVFGFDSTSFRGGEMIRKVSRGSLVPYFTGGICAAHVEDVVEGTLAAIAKGNRGERYILGGENIGFRDLALRSLEAFGISRPLIPVPKWLTGLLAGVSRPVARLTRQQPRFTPAAHYLASRFQYYSSDKAYSTLGYRPRNFDAILRECLA